MIDLQADFFYYDFYDDDEMDGDDRELDLILNNLEKYKSLDSANLCNRNLKMLPPRILNALQLKYLYLNGNKLIYEPDIGNLTQLEELCMENNQLSLIPDTYGSLKQLKCLSLSNNSIKCLNTSLMTSLNQLNILWLNSCELLYLPKEIGHLVHLEKIGLRSNCLVDLPDEFGRLTRLKWICLKDNRLERLPDSFGNLKSLGYLNLSANSFKQIPTVLASLSDSLVILELESNQIKSLSDDELLTYSNLRHLNLIGNPFVDQIQKTNKKFYDELMKLKNFHFI